MQNVSLTLPAPPLPLSRCFVNRRGGGRHESADYAVWKLETDMHLKKLHAHALGLPHRPRFSGDVRVEVIVKRPDRRKRDLDNLGKSSLDTLTRNYVIEDDSRIVDLRFRWDQTIKHPAVIEVEKVNILEKVK